MADHSNRKIYYSNGYLKIKNSGIKREFQSNGSDENNRYDELFMDFSGKYRFIRYNPDKFINIIRVKIFFFYNRMEAVTLLI